MALKIRLARGGAKKRPYYSIVVADSRSPRDGRFIEKLGTYNPMLDRSHSDRVTLKVERIQHWLGIGALPTDRVARFLGDAGLIEKPPVKDTPIKSRPKARAQERLKAAEEARAAAGHSWGMRDCISAVRASLRALLSMRFILDGIKRATLS